VVAAYSNVSPISVSEIDALHVVRVREGPASTVVLQLGALPAGYNETYGYPDGIGGLIVEGPFPYKNGPSVWSPSTPWGAYGMIVAAGKFREGKCDPLPADSPFAVSPAQHPVEMTNGENLCLLACNKSEVEATGVDPCHAGSLTNPLLSNSVMSCFDLGPGTAGGDGGACGYNCTALAKNETMEPCTDVGKQSCALYCDTRTFPPASKDMHAH
jgi:hypothetical protein